jgi:hypothetical protein
MENLMSYPRPPLFPAESDHTTLAKSILAGETPNEDSLRRLERVMLSWLLSPGAPLHTAEHEVARVGGTKFMAHAHLNAIELPEITLRAGQKNSLRVTLQRPFCAQRILLFSNEHLAKVKVTHLYFGVEMPLKIERDGISAELFRVMTRYPANYDITLMPGQSVDVLLDNTGPMDVDICGAVLGNTLFYSETI